MERPEHPTVKPSEPEREKHLLNKIMDMIRSGDTIQVHTFNSVLEYLGEYDLTVDSNGFIVDQDTGSFVEPYVFDSALFRQISGPVDDAFSAFCRPEMECESMIMLQEDKLHLKDLHCVHAFEDGAHPIRSNGLKLREMFGAIGLPPVTVEWSTQRTMLEENSDKTEVVLKQSLHENAEPHHPACYDCSETAPPEEWEEVTVDRNTDYRCPNCSTLWSCSRISACENCRKAHTWEDTLNCSAEELDSESNTGYASMPSCPHCNSPSADIQSDRQYDIMDPSESYTTQSNSVNFHKEVTPEETDPVEDLMSAPSKRGEYSEHSRKFDHAL